MSYNIDALSAVHHLRKLWTLVVMRGDQMMTFGPYLHQQDAEEAAERISSAAAEAEESVSVTVCPTVPPTSPLYVGRTSIWYQLGLSFVEPGDQDPSAELAAGQ